jgi:hypothetical protein
VPIAAIELRLTVPLASRPHAPITARETWIMPSTFTLAHARDLLPIVGIQPALLSDASAVHQDGQRTQLCLGAGEHRLDRGRGRDVCSHRDSPSTRGRNLRDHRLGRIGRAQHSSRTRRRHVAPGAAPLLGRAAGAARHLVATFHNVAFSPKQ